MGSYNAVFSAKPPSFSVIAVHQHLIRQGVCDLVSSAGLLAHSEQISDLESLLSVDESSVELIILCSSLPGLEGGSGITKIKEHFPSCPVIVIVDSPHLDTIMELVLAGSDGVLPLSTDAEEFSRAIATVSSGAIYIPRCGIFNAIPSREASSKTTPPSVGGLAKLTDRQRQVLSWMAVGETNKSIGRRLDISPHTVNMHIRAVFRTLDVHCRIEAINFLEHESRY